MATLVQSVSGKISALKGSAMVRGADGKMHALQLGDLVHTGDVILVAHNGTVQLTPDAMPAPRHAPAKVPGDIDRVIADLNSKDPKTAPAAGAAEGALTEGLRVGRVAEGVSPLSFEYGLTERAGPSAISGTAIESAPPTVSAVSSMIAATENGQRVGLGLQVPAGTPPTATIVVDKVPAFGQVFKSDGTLLVVGTALLPADLAKLVYQPPTHYAGEPVGLFEYTITNGTASAVGKTQITVAEVNEIPVLANDVATGLEDTSISGNVVRNDADPEGKPVTVTAFRIDGIDHAAGQPAVLAGIGTLVINTDGSYVFTPVANYNGPVPVATYTATDGQLTSTATLTLAVTPVNDAPVAANDIASTPINQPVDIAVLANDRDVDGDPLTVSRPTLADPTQGTVSVNPDGTLHFVPAGNLTGPVSISYTVTDPHGATDTATVTVNVGNNNPPASADQTLTTAEDTPLTLTTAHFTFTDADGHQTLNAVRIDTLPVNGTLALNGTPVTAGTLVSADDIGAGHLTFTPAPDANGAPYAYFNFSVQDSAGAFDTTPNTLTLNVTPVNDPPVAVADAQTTAEGTPVTMTVADLLGNDTDVDGDPLTLVSVQSAVHGTVAIISDHVVFTPDLDYTGPASFTYTVSDGKGGLSSATVNVSVEPLIAISDVTVNEAAGTATFTVTLDHPTTETVSVKYQTADGTATAADYTATAGTLTFGPGVTSQTVTVKITNDTVYERSESFNVVLSQATHASITDGTGVGTIRDDGTGTGGTDNDAPTLGVTSANAVEGTFAAFTVTLSNPSTAPVVFTPSLVSGTAIVGTDTAGLRALEVSTDGVHWQPVTGDVTIPAGATSVQLRLPTTDDALKEAPEDFTLVATPVSGAAAAPASAATTIIDNDGVPLLSIDNVTVNEAAHQATFTVTLSPVSGQAVTVDFATSNGTATAGADYVAHTGTLTFQPNVVTQTITVDINNDNTYEGAETFNVTLANAVNAVVADGLGIGTIRDDGTGPGGTDNDTPMVASVSSPTVAEGGNLDFAVTLTHPSTTPTTVALTPASGTAMLGTDTQPLLVSFDGGQHFDTVTGPTVSVPANATSFIVRVPTVDDGISEPSETLTLAAATPANPSPVLGTGTITDNDGTPALAISGPVLVDEAAGTATFTVTMSVPSSAPVSVNFGTVDGSATAGSDYQANAGTLTFAPNETSKTVTVTINDDTTYEGRETFSVVLSAPSGATLSNGSATTTIADDGSGGPDNDTPAVGSVSSPTVAEGGNLDFTVTLTNPSTTPTAVTLAPASGTADLPSDTLPALVSFNGGLTFTAINGATVSVPAGAISFIVRVPTVDDRLAEPTEAMTLAASTPANTAPVIGTGSIVDNDAPVLSLTGPAAVDEAAGTATFTVTLSNPSSTAVTVKYASADGSATAGSDYVAASGTLTFAPGETTKTIVVAITDDNVLEHSETLTMNLAAPSGATIAAGSGSVTTAIVDDGSALPDGSHSSDDTPSLAVAAISVAEGAPAVFTVTLSNPSTSPVVFTPTLASGTATLGTDTAAPAALEVFNGTAWVPVAGNVTIAPGATSVQLRLATVDDNISETNETFTLTATPVSGSTTAVAGNIATIVDNESAPQFAVNDVTVNEGAGTISFTVSLSNPAAGAVSVGYATADGTATAGADYTAASGTLSFAAGETSKTVTLAITNDTVYEGAETFAIKLSNPTGGALIAGAQGIGTIKDDGTGPGGSDNDTPQVGSVSSPSVVEGGNLDFLVSLTHASTTPTTVSLTPASGTATLGTDTQPVLVSFDGGKNFAPVVGASVSVPADATSFIVRVPTIDDNLGEPTEAMTLGAATPANPTTIVGTGTITDNDTPVVSVSGAVTYNEAAGTATYTVALNNAATTPVTVRYATSDGTATAGADYTAANGTLTFAPGETSKTVTVAIANDTTFEGPETFTFGLSAPSGATLGNATSLTTIADDGSGTGGTDNDTPAIGSVSSPTVAEGNNLDFSILLTHPSTTATTVTLTAASGTALLGTDTAPAQVSFNGGGTFTTITGPSVSVPAGATGFIVRIPTVDDTLAESTETLTLAASTRANATPVVGTGTITDNDNPPVAGNDVNSVTEDAPSTTLTVNAGNGLIQSTGAPAGRDTDADPGDRLTIIGVRTGDELGSGTAGTVGTALAGAYGTVTINADGSYTYVLNNASPAVQNLVAGQVATDVFTYTVTDSTGLTDKATLTINVNGAQDVTAGPPTLTPVVTGGLNGEYFGYNDTVTTAAGVRTHSDDGSAKFGIAGVAGNLNSVEDMYTIIDGRNALAGGANIVGTSATAAANVADVGFQARSLDYGFNPTVDSALGSNSKVAAGSVLPVGDNQSNSTTSALSNFLDQDRSTALVQTGAGNTNGTSGLGTTSDAAVRLSGQIYVQPGSYDFRVTADDGFRLNVAGQTLLEFDGNQAPTTRIFNHIQLGDASGGLQAFELLYWEQGGSSRLRIEYKDSNDPSSAYQVMSLSNTAMFSNETAPVLGNPSIQDLVFSGGSWQIQTGSILDGGAGNDTLTGGAGRDVLNGGAGNDTLVGNAGADTLDGGAGNDVLDGGAGNDTLIGSAGADTLRGGAGSDTYVLSDTLDTLVENANEGIDTVVLDATYVAANPGTTVTLATNFENLTAQGTSAINLTGNAADNRLEGNAAANVLSGGAGNDYLIGGGGNDTLTGGAGSDTFAWRLADHGAAGAPAVDTITDFVYGGGYSNVQSATAGVVNGGGDVLDLRDLLQGEHTSSGVTGNSSVEISNLLNFIDVQVSGANTVLHISSKGGFAGGAFSSSAEDQTIVLQGVNLYTATGTASGDETNLLKLLIKNGTLVVD